MGVCLPRDKRALLTRDVYRARRTTRTAAESVDNWHFYWMKVFITPSLSIGGPLGCHTLTISWAKKKKKRKKFGIVFVMQYSCFLQRGEKFVSREREKAGFSSARQKLGNAGCIWAFEKVICSWPLNLRHLLFLLFFFFLNERGVAVVAALEVTPQCSPEDASYRWLAVQLREMIVYITVAGQCHSNHRNLHLHLPNWKIRDLNFITRRRCSGNEGEASQQFWCLAISGLFVWLRASKGAHGITVRFWIC